jgi:HK97 family phage prohead protease
MPYFITDKAEGCSGWATVKEDGEVMGCHTTKKAAIDQMVAVSLAEDMEVGGERKADGPKAIILDIDDTLIHMGKPMQRVIDYVNALTGRKIIITGRTESERESTVSQLKSAGVEYTALFMKDTDQSTPAFKKSVAERLLQRYNVELAIDNDGDNRSVYKDLGILTLDPADIDNQSQDEQPNHNDSNDDMDVDNSRSSQESLENAKWKSIALNLNKDERQQMTTQVERRVNTVEFDVRNGEASSDGMSFTGYAAVFNSPSEPLPFTEVIKEGAFKRSLKSRNEIKLFMNHNTDVVLGSTRAGTLKLTEDSRGLLAQAELPDTSAGRDLSVLMKRGDVSSMSFGFSVPPKGDKWSQDGATRELHQVRLHEVSIVTGFPAYEATTASVRSLDILATRTAVDVDALSDAITRLEAGETLEPDHADLISEVVSKLRADKPNEMELLEIKRKQLDLMLKAF